MTKTLYKDTLKLSQPTEASSGNIPGLNNAPITSFGAARTESKVNKICDAFITVLSSRIDTNLQNLVTSHVCKSPPDLDAGLNLVAKLRGMLTLFHPHLQVLMVLEQNRAQSKQRKP